LNWWKSTWTAIAQEPEFVAMNPFHRIPVLVDDGFTVVESLAILDYLEVS